MSDDQWVEWTGGENPAGEQQVNTLHQSGTECFGWVAAQWGVSWLHEDPDDGENIVAYRVVSPAPAAPTNGGGGFETGLPNALDPMDPALLIHNLVGLRQLLDIERGSNWQGRCHFLNQTIRTVQHLAALQPQPTQQGGEGLRIRCMGPWPACKHAEGTCTASPDYQAMIAANHPTAPSASGGEAVEPVGWAEVDETGKVWSMGFARSTDDDQPLYLHPAPHPARMPTRDSVIGLLSDWFEGKVYGFIDTGEETIRALDGAEFNHFSLADAILALFHTGETKGDGRG